MLGDFTVKNTKLGREICILLKIDLVKTKCGVRHRCAKGFLHSNSNYAVIVKKYKCS